jgi:hypothetical protein
MMCISPSLVGQSPDLRIVVGINTKIYAVQFTNLFSFTSVHWIMQNVVVTRFYYSLDAISAALNYIRTPSTR